MHHFYKTISSLCLLIAVAKVSHFLKMKVGNLDINRQEIDMLFQKTEVVPLTKVVLEKLITIYFHMFLLSIASSIEGEGWILLLVFYCNVKNI